MSTNHSITRLLSAVKKDDEEAVNALFLRCYLRVAEIGQHQLRKPLPAFDENDAANAAFFKFLRGAKSGRFERLENREDFWKIMTLLVADKVKDRLQHERRQKRGGAVAKVPLEDVAEEASKLDGPSLKVEFADVRHKFLMELPSDEHRRVVELLELEHTHEEIAAELDVSVRTVARRLDVIRSIVPRVLGIADPQGIASVTPDEQDG